MSSAPAPPPHGGRRLATDAILHGFVIALFLLVALLMAGALIVVGVPLLLWAILLPIVGTLVLWRRGIVSRDPRRVAVFGERAFIDAVRAAAPGEGSELCVCQPAGEYVGQDLLRFIIQARAQRPGTLLIQLPHHDVALQRRLPRMVESEPALVLLGAQGAQQSRLGQPVRIVAAAPLRPLQMLAKRLLDVVISLFTLIMLAPLLLTVAIVIRLGSPGSPIFRQRRTGLLGQPFTMYKFRSMSVRASDDGAATTRHDPRVTRLGRWLRATSIDELPQLFNVVLGNMSIVGPRPHVPAHRVEDGIYAEVIPDYAARHRVLPGITGLAQVNGMRGGIETRERAQRGVALDLRYIREWSLMGDIRIIVRTLLGGMLGRDVF